MSTSCNLATRSVAWSTGKTAIATESSDHCTVQPAWNSLSVGWLWNSASLRVWQCRPGPSPCGGRGTRSLSVGGRDSVVELDAGKHTRVLVFGL